MKVLRLTFYGDLMNDDIAEVKTVHRENAPLAQNPDVVIIRNRQGELNFRSRAELELMYRAMHDFLGIGRE